MSKHSLFIETPISVILQDASKVFDCISWGMESFALAEYLLNSIFIKMTGAQEQKFKCLVWEIGAEDYRFRYEHIYGKWEYGECSALEAKTKILASLYESTHNLCKQKSFANDLKDYKEGQFTNVKQQIVDFYNKTLKRSVNQRDFEDFCRLWDKKFIYLDGFANIVENEKENKFVIATSVDQLKKDEKAKVERMILFSDIYNHLFRFRNICAHNLKSYQQDYYNLYELREKSSVTDNYFFRFATLMIMDAIAIKLYKNFQSVV